jgi:hypothetical protein
MFRHSPYQGLTPFDESDADYFFGRTKEARLIEADLFAASLTLLYGASGVGKSSVLRAGLLPRLRRRDDLVPVIFNSWQIDPARGLKDAVLAALAAIGGAELPSKDRGQQLLPLAEFLDSCAERSGRRLMIVLDQFEEYAFYHPEDNTFGREFPPATCLGNLSVSFIVSLREDSLATLDRFEGRIPTLFDSYRRIEHLSHAAAREPIIKPLLKFADDMGAEAGPTDTEATLVEAVIDEVQTGKVTVGESGSDILTPISSGRIEAPYQQLVMTRLWNRELELNSPLIRWETLASLGHARRIVQTHLDTVMDQLSPKDQDVAARVFHLLVTPSGTKIAHSVKDLAVYAGVDRDRLRHVLNALSSGQDRILRTTAALPEQPGEPRYEIFHDRLGSAVLDWRARYLQEYEAKEARRAEFGQSQLARALVELRMQSLSPAHRDTFASAVPHLVTHTGTRSSLTASDLPERTTVQRKDIEIVLRQLTQGTPPLILVVDERRAGPHHYQIADDVFGPALLTWAKQLAHSRKSERTKATDWTSKRYQRRIRRGQSRPPYAIIEDVAMEGDLTIVLGLGASILDGPRSAKQFEAGIQRFSSAWCRAGHFTR